MNQTKEQFYKTTKKYFLSSNENNTQNKNNHSESEIKKFYIKEGPFVNSTNVDYR